MKVFSRAARVLDKKYPVFWRLEILPLLNTQSGAYSPCKYLSPLVHITDWTSSLKCCFLKRVKMKYMFDMPGEIPCVHCYEKSIY